MDLITWLRNYRPLETFFQGHLTELDFCLLRCSSKELKALVPPPKSLRPDLKMIPLSNLALKGNYFRFAKWLVDGKCVFERKFLRKEYCAASVSEEEVAAQRDILLRYFSRHTILTSYCIQNDNFPLLLWAVEQHYPLLTSQVCSEVAAVGNIKMMEWALQKGFKPNKLSCLRAAEKGHIAMIEFLRQHGTPWDEFTTNMALERGHIPMLQWLFEHHAVFNSKKVYAIPAENGNLQVLKWARDNGFTMTENDSAAAANGGQLECLQFLHRNGCPWSEMVPKNAINGKHFSLVEWALENECPISEYEFILLTQIRKKNQQ
jgi:hypothetical protein